MRGFLLSGILVLFAVASRPVQAESGRRRLPAAKHQSLTFQLAASQKKDFYKEFVERDDTEITWIYIQQWRTHENQKAYRFSKGRQEFYSFVPEAATMNEGSQRTVLASYVMRLRLEGLFESYMSRDDAPGSAKRLSKTYSKIRSGVALSSGATTQLNLYYDFAQDLTRLRLQRSVLDASVVHQHTLGSLMGGAPVNQVSLQVGASLGSRARAYVQYELSSGMLESGLHKTLNSSLSGLVRVRSPLTAAGSSVLDAVLSLRF